MSDGGLSSASAIRPLMWLPAGREATAEAHDRDNSAMRDAAPCRARSGSDNPAPHGQLQGPAVPTRPARMSREGPSRESSALFKRMMDSVVVDVENCPAAHIIEAYNAARVTTGSDSCAIDEMDAATLRELRLAFDACDVNGDDSIQNNELLAVLNALGNDITEAIVDKIVVCIAATFDQRLHQHSALTDTNALRLDHHEHGSHRYGRRQHGKLSLKKQSKPLARPIHRLVALCASDPGVHTPRRRSGPRAPRRRRQKATKPHASANMFKYAGSGSKHAIEQEPEDEDSLTFAEFVHLIMSPGLGEWLPGDWRTRCKRLRVLREAFDNADVDGNGYIEFEELETVLLSLAPSGARTLQDVQYLWATLCRGQGKTSGDVNAAQSPSSPARQDLQLMRKARSRARGVFGGGCCAAPSHPHGHTNDDRSEPVPVCRSDSDSMNALTWVDFLAGIKIVNRDERASTILDLDNANQWELISLLVDTQVSQVEAMKLWEGMSWLQKKGMGVLQAQTPPITTHMARETLVLMNQGKLHHLDKATRHTLKQLTKQCVFRACMIGMITNVPHSMLCNVLTNELETRDGFENAYWVPCGDGDANATVPQECPDSPTLRTSLLYLGFRNLAMVVLLVIELLWLIQNAMHSTAHVAPLMKLRLTPLNADRAFVADSLFRAVFEMGNPTTPVMGVDPASHTSAQSRFKLVLLALIFTGKIAFTTFVIVKVLYFAILSIEAFTWVEPWIGPFSCAGWDALVCYAIVNNAKVRMIGVTTAPEVFHQIIQSKFANVACISPAGRLQLVRAIGVAVVVHGSMFSNMELLLRHAIQYLGLKGSADVLSPGSLDNEQLFFATMHELPKAEQEAVLSVVLLAMVLDGNLERREKQLLEKLIGISEVAEAEYSEEKCNSLALLFSELHPMTADMIEETWDRRSLPSAEKTTTILRILHRTAFLLSK